MGNVIAKANDFETGSPEYNRFFPFALPYTSNHYLQTGGPLALYSANFVIAGEVLLMHGVFFGLFAILQGFSVRRMMDQHYLSLVLAFTFILLPIHFLFDMNLDQSKLTFFVEHVAIEYLIGVRVLAPAKFVAARSGLILLLMWLMLVASSAVIVGNHAAVFVVVIAFISDTILAVSGAVLIWRWSRERHSTAGFRITAMVNAPVVAVILWGNYHAQAFAIEWTSIFMTGLLCQGMQVPVAALFFQNLACCCTRRRKVSPGQAEWQDEPLPDDDSSVPSTLFKTESPV
ncbi:uncharacterized protein SEPMUDRAFT_135291 [Sphaerulina musiva SO2202]|uniref:Uncharacterized protein n=1 Tax=Sphaerulina musiva (strain SO2202) TaxID=692275 RepID=M3D062_SPHMS|nr:uncharacterized protein SEPMUDRAFT_135291 [Sphaerulina musiva SO2202]EMF09873.1 hypothetical protein SEPMUDRAFT_135291 [Sphaerulina musiva SO2202]